MILDHPHTEWKYCAIANIKKQHIDKNGILRYGTSAFSGGTRVYLRGTLWDENADKIPVLGLCRGKHYYVSWVSAALLENVRFGRVYKPSVLKMMNHWEYQEGWWHDTPEDRAQALDFVRRWKEKYKSDVDEIPDLRENAPSSDDIPENSQ